MSKASVFISLHHDDNIEWIECESTEMGASNPESLVDAFGEQNRAQVLRIFTDWAGARENLVARLPRLNMSISNDNRAEIRQAVFEFMDATMRQNAEFLQLAITTYKQHIWADLAGDGRLASLGFGRRA